MIKKLLGQPDWVESGWGDRSKRVYRACYVEAVEAGSNFRELFASSARRRKLDDAFISTVLERSLTLEHSGAVSAWDNTLEIERAAKKRNLRKINRENKKRKSLENATFTPPSHLVCSVAVNTIINDLHISIRFSRENGLDRVYCEKYSSIEAISETQGTTGEAITKLLPNVLISLLSFAGAIRFSDAGLVDEMAFTKLLDELNARILDIKNQNLDQKEETIISLASDLRLVPEPSFVSSGVWKARCPGTNHCLLLNATRNEFWCGYCNRSGNLHDLRLLVDERSRLN
ncbi:MAG: hypothetical protein EBS01_06020 [Verrucomicrobia bacterium]|nr:hypothetical protein [Verrucomicrobiota bacterium]